MKHVYFCCNMPHGTAFIGGIAAIVHSCLAHEALFAQQDCQVSLFDYQNAVIRKIPFTPLRTMIYGMAQRNHLRKILQNEKAADENIVHIHTSRSFLYLKDVWLGRSLRKRKLAMPVLTIHVGDISTVHKHLPACIQKLAVSWLNRYFGRVIFLSRKMQQQFVALGLNEKISEVLYNFHDFEGELREKESEDSRLHLLFVGMINRDKGILELLEAMKCCRHLPIMLDICGTITDESIREAYQAGVAALGDRVKEWGYVRGEQKKLLFQQADVLVLPSYHEGLPLVVLEALAARCALALTPVGALPEILTEKNTLWLTIGDTASIAHAIETLSQNAERLEQMKAANSELGKQYTLQEHICRLCAVYSAAEVSFYFDKGVC